LVDDLGVGEKRTAEYLDPVESRRLLAEEGEDEDGGLRRLRWRRKMLEREQQ